MPETTAEVSLKSQFFNAIIQYHTKNGKTPTLEEIGFFSDIKKDPETNFVTSVEIKKTDENGKPKGDELLKRNDIFFLIDKKNLVDINNALLDFFTNNFDNLQPALSHVRGLLQLNKKQQNEDNFQDEKNIVDEEKLRDFAEKAWPAMKDRIEYPNDLGFFLEQLKDIKNPDEKLVASLEATHKKIKADSIKDGLLAPNDDTSPLAEQFKDLKIQIENMRTRLKSEHASITKNPASTFASKTAESKATNTDDSKSSAKNEKEANMTGESKSAAYDEKVATNQPSSNSTSHATP